jgi:sec-independent protein translocase protein TatC
MAGQDDETPDSELDEGGPVKNFLEHLEDFRWVLIKCAAAVGVAMLLCLIGANYVIGVLKWPLTHDKLTYVGDSQTARFLVNGYNLLPCATVNYPGTNQVAIVNFGTNRIGKFQLTTEQEQSLHLGTNRFVAVQVDTLTVGTNQVLGWRVITDPSVEADAHKVHIDLVNLSPAGGFFVAFQVAIYGGLVLAGPFVLYFIGTFIFPALKINEKKPIFRALMVGGVLFLVGVAFCFFLLMPVALAASQKYSEWLGLGAFEWRAEDYISFVCKFMLGMGVGFELPVVLLTLVKIGILNYRSLRGMWRYMIVINLVLGALLTTPEVVTQVLMAVPLYMLYEVSVWVAWYWEWRDRKRGLIS